MLVRCTGEDQTPIRRLLVLAVLVIASTGCVRTLAGRLRARHPVDGKLETYRSGMIVLDIGDVQVTTPTGHHPLLSQRAWFEVVNENEMRFHLQLVHRWKELTGLSGVRVVLTTSRGDRLRPASSEKLTSVYQQYDVTLGYIRSAPRGARASISEETIRRELYGTVTVLVFRARGLVSREVRSYTLSVTGGRRCLRFTWDLVPAAEMADEE